MRQRWRCAHLYRPSRLRFSIDIYYIIGSDETKDTQRKSLQVLASCCLVYSKGTWDGNNTSDNQVKQEEQELQSNSKMWQRNICTCTPLEMSQLYFGLELDAAFKLVNPSFTSLTRTGFITHYVTSPPPPLLSLRPPPPSTLSQPQSNEQPTQFFT